MPFVKGERHPLFHLKASPQNSYCGRVSDDALRRIVHLAVLPDSTLSIARTYLPHDEFALTWHFNHAGRIMDIFVETNGGTPQSTRVLQVTAPKESWNVATASCANIPTETDNLNHHFSRLSQGEKYYQLIRYGHSFAHKINAHVQDRTILDAYAYIQGQRPLLEILKDTNASKTLSLITKLHVARVDYQVNPSSLSIEYTLFLTKEERTQYALRKLGLE